NVPVVTVVVEGGQAAPDLTKQVPMARIVIRRNITHCVNGDLDLVWFGKARLGRFEKIIVNPVRKAHPDEHGEWEIKKFRQISLRQVRGTLHHSGGDVQIAQMTPEGPTRLVSLFEKEVKFG